MPAFFGLSCQSIYNSVQQAPLVPEHKGIDFNENEALMPLIRFTPALKRFFPELKEMETEAKDVREAMSLVDAKYPGLIAYILDEQGQLRKHVNIFVGEDMIADRLNLSDQLQPKDIVSVIQALSGG